jgi:GTP 3',8-cyclase
VSYLIDPSGRRIRKLRVSLTDQCNFRCLYCMPSTAEFMPKKNHLTVDQYVEIITELVELGVEEVRLTGGEPLMRAEFSEIVTRLSVLPLKKLALTTNGALLHQHWPTIEKHITHLNISLDSLNVSNFKNLSLSNSKEKVLNNIFAAKNCGLNVKINMVVMRDKNDHEISDFVRFSEKHHIEVRFLELMKIGYAVKDQDKLFISADEIYNRLKDQFYFEPVPVAKDSTSYNYKTADGAQVGFIASESKPFCGHCSRWRLTADGVLKSCLMKAEGENLKNTTATERLNIYQKLLPQKPILRQSEVHHQMNQIGG